MVPQQDGQPHPDPIQTAMSAVELQGFMQLDLSNLRHKMEVEKASKEYTPWYVDGPYADRGNQYIARMATRLDAPEHIKARLAGHILPAETRRKASIHTTPYMSLRAATTAKGSRSVAASGKDALTGGGLERTSIRTNATSAGAAAGSGAATCPAGGSTQHRRPATEGKIPVLSGLIEAVSGVNALGKQSQGLSGQLRGSTAGTLSTEVYSTRGMAVQSRRCSTGGAVQAVQVLSQQSKAQLQALELLHEQLHNLVSMQGAGADSQTEHTSHSACGACSLPRQPAIDVAVGAGARDASCRHRDQHMDQLRTRKSQSYAGDSRQPLQGWTCVRRSADAFVNPRQQAYAPSVHAVGTGTAAALLSPRQQHGVSTCARATSAPMNTDDHCHKWGTPSTRFWTPVSKHRCSTPGQNSQGLAWSQVEPGIGHSSWSFGAFKAVTDPGGACPDVHGFGSPYVHLAGRKGIQLQQPKGPCSSGISCQLNSPRADKALIAVTGSGSNNPGADSTQVSKAPNRHTSCVTAESHTASQAELQAGPAGGGYTPPASFQDVPFQAAGVDSPQASGAGQVKAQEPEGGLVKARETEAGLVIAQQPETGLVTAQEPGVGLMTAQETVDASAMEARIPPRLRNASSDAGITGTAKLPSSTEGLNSRAAAAVGVVRGSDQKKGRVVLLGRAIEGAGPGVARDLVPESTKETAPSTTAGGMVPCQRGASATNAVAAALKALTSAKAGAACMQPAAVAPTPSGMSHSHATTPVRPVTRERVVEQAQQRFQQLKRLPTGVLGPVLMDDWRSIALQRISRTAGGRRPRSGRPNSSRPISGRPRSGRPRSGRPQSGRAPRPASGRASRPSSSRPPGLLVPWKHSNPNSSTTEHTAVWFAPQSPSTSRTLSTAPASSLNDAAGLIPASAPPRHVLQVRDHARKAPMKVRSSVLGAQHWARLRAMGPRKVLKAACNQMMGQSCLNSQAVGQGNTAPLNFIQHLQEANGGLAAGARLRMHKLEKTTPALQAVSSPRTESSLTGTISGSTTPAMLSPRITTSSKDPVVGEWGFTGTYGTSGNIKQRMQAANQALVAANPAAFNEELALQAEAEYRAAAERAALKLSTLANLSSPSTTTSPPLPTLAAPSSCVDEAPAPAVYSTSQVHAALASAVCELKTARPFFHAPLVPKERLARAHTDTEAGRKKKQAGWSLEKSVFAQRKRECESRNLLDTDQVKTAQFKSDWQRVVSKSRFRRLVAREDKGVADCGEGLERELGEIRQELEAQQDLLRAMFNYYSMIGSPTSSSSILSIGMNQWLSYCNEMSITNNTEQRGTSSGDLQTIFVAANYKEESETLEGETNDDDAMMRFEFLEGIIRVAFAKFITTKQCDDASDAVHMLIHEVLKPAMPDEVWVEPNKFRQERLYNEEMDSVVRQHMDILQAIFKLYKATDRTKYFAIEHWAALLESTQLIGPHTGIDYKALKIIFVWSQMIVTDELKRRKRAVCLQFFDFVEALARLAELLSAPTPQEVDRWFSYRPDQVAAASPTASRLSEYYRLVLPSAGLSGEVKRRASAELLAVPTRPLGEKLTSLLEVLVERLRGLWGGRDEKACAVRMKRMAETISGGIELG